MTTNNGKTVRYSLKIKQQVLRRILSGELTVITANREYGIRGKMTIYRWLDRRDQILGTSPSDMANDSPDRDKSKEELATELASLRQLLEHERLRSEAYLTMIKIAEEKFQISIEKKSGAKPSSK